MSITTSVPAAQANTAQFLEDLVGFCGDLSRLLARAQSLQARQTANDYVTKINALSTYALNTDGSAGTTDGSPVTTNPIVGVNISATQISAAIGFLVGDLVTMLTGSGNISEPVDRRATIGKMLP